MFMIVLCVALLTVINLACRRCRIALNIHADGYVILKRLCAELWFSELVP